MFPALAVAPDRRQPYRPDPSRPSWTPRSRKQHRAITAITTKAAIIGQLILTHRGSPWPKILTRLNVTSATGSHAGVRRMASRGLSAYRKIPSTLTNGVDRLQTFQPKILRNKKP